MTKEEVKALISKAYESGRREVLAYVDYRECLDRAEDQAEERPMTQLCFLKPGDRFTYNNGVWTVDESDPDLDEEYVPCQAEGDDLHHMLWEEIYVTPL